ncbi:MAG: PD-(D/E)XK nuclease family protein [Candidatus Poseidoniaceae archaeon]|nr:PD-(D/E)XK nuclease family protein [Candidatus Poseidoniaceae archaeon]
MTVNITVEACPSDCVVPRWVIDEIANGYDDLLVIYPNEATRARSIQTILQESGSVDSSRHTTLQRLVNSLSIDFRLPVVIPRTSIGLVQVHEKFATAASKHRFPRLHPDTARPWTLSKSERLLSLHSYATSHQILSRWDDDPGAHEADRILSTFEKEDLIHEHHVLSHLCSALSDSERPIPYTVGTITGIILLNHPPDFSESEKRFLKALSSRRPIHHICVTGSFRLGFHGAYIDDEIKNIEQKEQLPPWVPSHPIYDLQPQPDDYTTDGVQIFSFDRASQVMDAAISALQLYQNHSDGSILIVDANKARHNEWSRRLKHIGVTCNTHSDTVGSTSAVQAILRFLSISRGQDAWSATKLFDIVQSQAFPIMGNLFSDLEHPVNEGWRPRPHLDVIENIGRSFHVLGGKGALQRWLGSLSAATPHSMESYRREEESRALEETQWWIQCLAVSWSALLSENERSFISNDFIGTSSKVALPLPQASNVPREVLTTILQSCNWELLFGRTQRYDASVSAVQAWVQAIDAALHYESSVEFVDICRLTSEQTKLPAHRIDHTDVRICTPFQAYGIPSDITMFVGLDAESWSMKPERIPWIDDSVRVELGLTDGDLPIRKARHLFKSLLNSSQQAILFDTKHDESVGNSTPVIEYLSMVELKGELSKLSNAPDFIESSVSDGAGWSMITREGGNFLTYRTSSLSVNGREVRLERAENTLRDQQQLTGLELKAMRPPTTIILSPNSIATRHEREIHLDRFRRQPKFKSLENGDTMDWGIRNNLLTTTNLVIQPTVSQAKVAGGRTTATYPHLGYKKNGNSRGPSIDPRPLPPPQYSSASLNVILSTQSKEQESKVWSTSRLNPWLMCPRQAWMEQTLQATENSPEPSEDIAPLTKGTLVHSIEEHLLTLLGIEVGGNPLARGAPMHLGIPLSNQEIWESMLGRLSELAPWLTRTNAVSVHRCNDLIGCSPEDWNAWIEGSGELSIGGRLGRLLIADLNLISVAPIASEWPLQNKSKAYVEIEGFDDEMEIASIDVRGRIDRVDHVVFDDVDFERMGEQGLYAKEAEKMPLLFNGKEPPAKRFIIIRDLKTIEGPKPGKTGSRHAAGLFKEIQLALYARAWEIAHPGDRVVGVGISEVGDDTEHFVEIDPSFSFLESDFDIGTTTLFSKNHFRIPNEDTSPQSNSFRAWMSSRITAALRARDANELGWNHPTPGSHCSYCSLASACSSASIGGELK